MIANLAATTGKKQRAGLAEDEHREVTGMMQGQRDLLTVRNSCYRS